MYDIRIEYSDKAVYANRDSLKITIDITNEHVPISKLNKIIDIIQEELLR